MGICISFEATAVTPRATAKLVLEDGTLQEFSWPVRTSHVLGEDHRTRFVCSADDMEFDGFVSAFGLNDELELGQLYFVLPRSMLKHPLQPDDMATLAVKASTALMSAPGSSRAGKFRFRRGPAAPPVFSAAEKATPMKKRGGRGRSFMSKLNPIPE